MNAHVRLAAALVAALAVACASEEKPEARTAAAPAVTPAPPAAPPPEVAPPPANPAPPAPAPPAPAPKPKEAKAPAPPPASPAPPATPAEPRTAEPPPAGSPGDGAHARVGADKCKMCHRLQHQSWSESPHAAKGLDCEGCHGNGGDYWSPSVMRDREKALAAGLVLPSLASCKRCHAEADASLLPRVHAHKAR